MARGDQIKKLWAKAWPKVNVELERFNEQTPLTDRDGSSYQLSSLRYNGIHGNQVSITRSEYCGDGRIEKFSVGSTFSSVVRRVQGNLLFGVTNLADVRALSAMAKLPRQPKPPKTPTVS